MSSTSPHLHIRAVIFFLPKCLLLLLICIFGVLFFFFLNVFYFSSFAYSVCYFFSFQMSSTSPHLHIRSVIFFLPKCLLLLLICIFGLFFLLPNVFYFSSFAYSGCYFFSSKMSSTSPHLHIWAVIFFLPKCLLLLLICIFRVLFFFFPNVFYFSSFAYSGCQFIPFPYGYFSPQRMSSTFP